MTLLSVWTGGFHSADWCQEGTACCGWSEKNIPSYITQALSSKQNPPPPCPKYSPFSAVLKYNCARSALERVLTSALLTVLMAIFFSFTQMAKNSLPATPGGDTQLRGALDWTVGGGVHVCSQAVFLSVHTCKRVDVCISGYRCVSDTPEIALDICVISWP